jgi:hypothetical protein
MRKTMLLMFEVSPGTSRSGRMLSRAATVSH